MNPSGKKKKRDLHNKEAQAYIVEICIGSAPFFVFYISFPAFVNTVPYIVRDTLLMYSVIRIMIDLTLNLLNLPFQKLQCDFVFLFCSSNHRF